jgi:hypothetical protein
MKQSSFFRTIKAHHKLLKKLLLTFLIIFVIGTVMSTVHGQAIFVDKVDYMPGDVVKITGFS